MFLLPHCHSSGVYRNEMYDGNDRRTGRKNEMYDGNDRRNGGRFWRYTVIKSFYYTLSDQLFEGRFIVFTNEIVKPKANTKKVLKRGITKQMIKWNH